MKRAIGILLALCLLLGLMPVGALAEGAQGSVPPAPVSDITGHWAEAVLQKWIGLGLLVGSKPNTYLPNSYTSKVESLALINRVFGFEKKQDHNIPAVPVTAWYYGDVCAAMDAGYLDLDFISIDPTGPISREQFAGLLGGAMGLQETTRGLEGFEDADQIAHWLKGYVGACVEAGFMRGDAGSNRLRPKGKLTRAEAITMLDRSDGVPVKRAILGHSLVRIQSEDNRFTLAMLDGGDRVLRHVRAEWTVSPSTGVSWKETEDGISLSISGNVPDGTLYTLTATQAGGAAASLEVMASSKPPQAVALTLDNLPTGPVTLPMTGKEELWQVKAQAVDQYAKPMPAPYINWKIEGQTNLTITTNGWIVADEKAKPGSATITAALRDTAGVEPVTAVIEAERLAPGESSFVTEMRTVYQLAKKIGALELAVEKGTSADQVGRLKLEIARNGRVAYTTYLKDLPTLVMLDQKVVVPEIPLEFLTRDDIDNEITLQFFLDGVLVPGGAAASESKVGIWWPPNGVNITYSIVKADFGKTISISLLKYNPFDPKSVPEPLSDRYTDMIMHVPMGTGYSSSYDSSFTLPNSMIAPLDGYAIIAVMKIKSPTETVTRMQGYALPTDVISSALTQSSTGKATIKFSGLPHPATEIATRIDNRLDVINTERQDLYAPFGVMVGKTVTVNGKQFLWGITDSAMAGYLRDDIAVTGFSRGMKIHASTYLYPQADFEYSWYSYFHDSGEIVLDYPTMAREDTSIKDIKIAGEVVELAGKDEVKRGLPQKGGRGISCTVPANATVTIKHNAFTVTDPGAFDTDRLKRGDRLFFIVENGVDRAEYVIEYS